MRFPSTLHNTNLLDTPQIIDDILAFSKIHFLQRITNLNFLVFDHAAEVWDMRRGRFKGKVLFNLD